MERKFEERRRQKRETYLSFLNQKVKPPPIRRRDTSNSSTAMTINPADTWLPSAWGNIGGVSAQDPSLVQVTWSKHM